MGYFPLNWAQSLVQLFLRIHSKHFFEILYQDRVLYANKKDNNKCLEKTLFFRQKKEETIFCCILMLDDNTHSTYLVVSYHLSQLDFCAVKFHHEETEVILNVQVHIKSLTETFPVF